MVTSALEVDLQQVVAVGQCDRSLRARKGPSGRACARSDQKAVPRPNRRYVLVRVTARATNRRSARTLTATRPTRDSQICALDDRTPTSASASFGSEVLATHRRARTPHQLVWPVESKVRTAAGVPKGCFFEQIVLPFPLAFDQEIPGQPQRSRRFGCKPDALTRLS